MDWSLYIVFICEFVSEWLPNVLTLEKTLQINIC